MTAAGAIRASGAALGLAGLAVICASLWLTLHYLLPAPWFDSWMFVPDVARLVQGHYTLHDLLRQHNEHRIATARMFLLADAGLFHMTGWAVALFNFGLLAGQGVAVWLLWRGRGAVPPVLAVVGLCCSMSAWFDLIEPFQIQFVLTNWCVLAAACLLVAATGPRGAGGWRWAYLGGALAAVLGAAFSMQSGLLALPALLAVLWLRRAGRGVMLGFLAGCVLVVAAFETGYTQSDYHRTLALTSPGDFAVWTICAAGFLGSAVAARGYWPVAAGVAGFAVFVPVTVAVARGRWRGAGLEGRLAAAYGMAAWAAISALACGMTRGMFGVVNAVNSRYAPVSALFLACLAILVFGLLARGGRARPWLPAATLACVAGLLAAENIGRDTYGTMRMLHRAVSAQAALLRQNVRVEGAFPMVLFDTIDSIVPQIAFLHANHLSLFAASADPPGWVARAVAGALAHGAPSCRGAVNAAFRIDARRFALRAWLADGGRPMMAAWIGIGDEQGRIVGVVTPLEPRPDVASVLGEVGAYSGVDSGFGGNMPPDPGRGLRLVGVMADGTACQLPGQFTPGAPPAPGAPGLGDWTARAAAAARAHGTNSDWAAIY